MSNRADITAADIIDAQTYAAMRKLRRVEMIARKKSRRLAIGPNATMHFENVETMLYQAQEMLHTEKGGDERRAQRPGRGLDDEPDADMVKAYDSTRSG